MNSFLRIAAVAIASLAGANLVPAAAQTPGAPRSKIDVTYRDPTAKYTAVMANMKKEQLLERLSRFLAPLRFPHLLHLIAEECDVKMSTSPHYNSVRRAIVICYQFEDLIARFAPAADAKSAEGLTRHEVMNGTLWGVVLHEAGHALFDMLEVPVFGAEEDAADQMAIFLALLNAQSKDVARAMIGGFAHFWKAYAESTKEHWAQWKAYTDTHGSDIQRYRNSVCLAYGADSATFKEFIDKAELSPERIANCRNEYAQVQWAFGKTIAPFINQTASADSRSQVWVTPDGK
jgi:putative metallopeptidase DUF4344